MATKQPVSYPSAAASSSLHKLAGGFQWLLFFLGLVTTVALAIATQDIAVLDTRWLATLLTVNQFVLILLIIGIAYALWRIWHNQVRMVRNLSWVLLLQFLIAISIAILPLLLINTATEDYYGEQLDEAIEASEAIRSSVILQTVQQMEFEAQDVSSLLRLDANEGEGNIGLLLDDFRSQRSLALVATITGNGKAKHISPPDADLPEVAPLELQRIREGVSRHHIKEHSNGQLHFVWLQPLETISFLSQGDDQPVALWLERQLGQSLSDNILAIEEGLNGYRSSRALRAGKRQGLVLVVTNAIALLIFSSLSMAAHLGNRLGRRLGRLSAMMQEVAGQKEPSGMVPESGNDEITTVTRSFNEMIGKVGSLVRIEKQQKTTLETIQDTMEAGVLVLDDNLRIVNINNAAKTLLGGSEESSSDFANYQTLADIAADRPDTAAFFDWVVEAANPTSGETSVGQRKLHVRTASFEVAGRSKPRTLVLFTDISGPLAEEESRVREHIFSFTLHGINNPLQAALGQAELLEHRVASVENEEVRSKLVNNANKILYHLKRISEQTRELGKFIGFEQIENTAIDLNEKIREVIAHANLGKIQVEQELESGLPEIRFDANILKDTLENLLKNAYEQCESARCENCRIKISTAMDAEGTKLICEDNAGGISPAALPYIFKPHKSFKEGGHGIGLARMQYSLTKGGASITAENCDTLGAAGTRFVATFPLNQIASQESQ